MLLYCFIGASADALIEGDPEADDEGLKPMHENQVFVVSGIALSLVMLTAITHFIKRELNRVSARVRGRCFGDDRTLLTDMICLLLATDPGTAKEEQARPTDARRCGGHGRL